MRALIVALVAAAVGGAAGWGATRQEFGRPESPLPADLRSSATPQAKVAVVGSESHDFGSMNVNDTKEYVFTLKNEGNAPLTLKEGHTSCKCTLSELKADGLSPGETTEVRLEWTPIHANESFEQSAEVITNDPNVNVVRLVIRGRVREAIKLEPSFVQLGEFSANDPRTFDVKVFSFRDEPWQFEDFALAHKDSAEHFALEARDMTPKELKSLDGALNGQVLHITIKPGLRLGSLHQTFRIDHNYSAPGEIELPVFGKVVGDITVLGAGYDTEHEVVDFGNVPVGERRTARLFLAVKGEHREETQISLKSIDPEDALSVELGKPTGASGKTVLWPVTVEIRDDAQPVNRLGSELGRFARVEFETTHPEIPSFLVKFRFAITPDH